MRPPLVPTLALAVASALAVTTAIVVTGSSSSGGGTASAKAKPTPTVTPCNSGNGNGNGNGNCLPGSDNKTFTVTGNITDLAPGIQRALSLSVKNNASQKINVRTITVQAADVRDAFGVVVCSAANLLLGTSGSASAGSISPSGLQINGGATVTGISFPIRLAASANDDCQRARWILTYSGTADQA